MGGRNNVDPLQREMERLEKGRTKSRIESGIDSSTASIGSNGKYVGTRASMHTKIINSLLRESNPHKNPTMTLVLGAENPHSRQKDGSIMNHEKEFRNFKKSTYLSVDKIIKRLPEYSSLVKSKGVNEAKKLLRKEASDIYNRTQKALISSKRSATLHVKNFGDVSKAKQSIDKLKSKGFRVRLLYGESTNPKAVSVNSKISKVYDELKGSATSYAKYTGAKRTESYAPAYTRTRGKTGKKPVSNGFNKTIATKEFKAKQRIKDKKYGNSKTKTMSKKDFMSAVRNKLKKK